METTAADPQPAPAASSAVLTAEAVFKDKIFETSGLSQPHWLQDGRRFSYVDTAPGSETKTLWTYTVETGERTLLVPVSALKLADAEQPSWQRAETDPPPAENQSETLAIQGYQWSPDESEILFANVPHRRATRGDQDLMIYALATGKLRRVSTAHKEHRCVKWSPDGTRLGYVREDDLYLLDLATGHELRVTDTAGSTRYNGRFGWVYEEELSQIDGWAWSPDGQFLFCCQVDESDVPEVDLPDYDDLHMRPLRTRYPKAGDPNPTVTITVIGAAGGHWNDLRQLDLGLEPDDYVARVQWTPHNELLVQRIPRLQNRIDLLCVDPLTGTCRTVLTETDPAWVSTPGDLTFIPDQKSVERLALSVENLTEKSVERLALSIENLTEKSVERLALSIENLTEEANSEEKYSTLNAQRSTLNACFLWPSDRDCHRHLYLYDTAGTLLAQLTRGEWEVERIVGIDAVRRYVYFTAAYPVPQERHLFRVSLNGGEIKRLTVEAGVHSILLAPDGGHYLDTYSSRASAPQVRLHRADGDFEAVVHASALPKLENVPLGRWEFTTFRTEAGVTLHAAILKPHDFDPAKRYPALMYTYGGPGSQATTDQWNGRGLDQLLASRGCLYVLVDGRGSGMRGRDFMKCTYLNLGHYEVEDQIAGAKWLGSLPYVDSGRIGIWGWSYGGYMAALCILRGADVFRSAVAVAPVTHWRFYDSIYTERYMRRPAENPEGYERSSPLAYVDRLKGAFLLIHGTADDNVHFQNALRLAAELQKQGRPFRMMAYPGKRHDIADVPLHLFGMITDFITETL